MTTRNLIALIALAAVPLVACSGTSASRQPDSVVVTIRGTNTEGIGSAMLAVGDVSTHHVSSSSGYLSGAFDLGDGNARLVAEFPVAMGAGSMTLHFDDYGGYEMSSGEAGVVDARGKSLSISIPEAALASGKAEIAVDMARSLVTCSAGRVLEPVYSTSY